MSASKLSNIVFAAALLTFVVIVIVAVSSAADLQFGPFNAWGNCIVNGVCNF